MEFRTAYGPHLVVGLECKDPSLTKQSFADESDINNIMKRFEKTGVLPDLQNITGIYADVSDVPDFQTALAIVDKGNSLFMQLPASIRSRFQNDPALFLDFVSNPANRDDLVEMGLIESPPATPPATPAPVAAVGSPPSVPATGTP